MAAMTDVVKGHPCLQHGPTFYTTKLLVFIEVVKGSRQLLLAIFD